MAGVSSEEAGVGRSTEGISSGQRCQSGDALVEWRSCEQVENGTPSTSPPYWDTDDNDDGGLKPSELYGKHTWKIAKFSQINKRELRSDPFEVGGYKWYILIYPQGCDVCNHLSLFLCVANHDELLPGWSHFAQFTIAVVNKDPKKSKYSDTLHRFWKKEHDWGWKKFMELSKVYDGFIDSDTLIIKAQVQVIREKTDRPFRCLDCQYRRELVRVYLTNVEQICRRFVEERRGKLGRLIEDKARWSSFCAFWWGIDQNARRRMSREKTDVILKVVVKHFFIEKEVTSTLVMDSLYSGLKALEGQSKCTKAGAKLLDFEEMAAPIVRVEKDTFILVDDVLLLLERAALEPLPPKDEKGPQNRTKDGTASDDFNKDSIERDERRLTELGRRTVEIFVLAHIFSHKIEVAYQEAVALKRQEELIREEEAAGLAEVEQKAKKEKKSKKKQAKQKRHNRKGKDKGREDRANENDKHQEENLGVEKGVTIADDAHPVRDKPDMLEDVSDVSDSVDGVADALPPDSDDRDVNPVNSDTDTSEVHPSTETGSTMFSSLSSMANGTAERKSSYMMDDSSSTCSTDSVPSVVMNGPYKGGLSSNNQNKKSPNRGKNQHGKVSSDTTLANEADNKSSGSVLDASENNDVTGSSRGGESETEATVTSLLDHTKLCDQNILKKEEVSHQNKQSIKVPVDAERLSKDKKPAVSLSPRSPPISPPSIQLKLENKSAAASDPDPSRKLYPNGPLETDHTTTPSNISQVSGVSKSETQRAASPKPPEKPVAQQVPVMSRPSSAPLFPGPRPSAPVISPVQTAPLLARSVSAAGRLGPDPSPATHSYFPQSYRNAIIGNSISSSSAGYTHQSSSSSGVNTSPAYSQATSMMSAISAPMFMPQNTERRDHTPVRSGFSFGIATRDVLQQNGPQWMDGSQRNGSKSLHSDSSLINDIQNLDLYRSVQSGSRENFISELPASTSGRQIQGVLADDFPHLDIINDLLDDEQGIGRAARGSTVYPSLGSSSQSLTRQFSFPSDATMSEDIGSSSGSCRFERTQSFHNDGYQRGYSPANSQFDSVGEFVPQASTFPYANGQLEGLIPNQWQMAGSDITFGMSGTEGDTYPYYNPEYANLACSMTGYSVFRPSNGH